MDQPIDVTPETTAAFVGRALRGPLNTPVLVSNFAEFRRRFGATWPRSNLSPAVEEFFRHGGRRLHVVRVANNARGAMICLPADGSALVLRAVEPGSTECIRAAVDYDGVEDSDELFNLTLQRVDPESGLVVDQELFAGVSFREEARKFVGDALAASRLAQAEQPYPSHRPDATQTRSHAVDAGYVDAVQSGTDGAELSDYDLIGSRRDQTGLFALEQVEDLDLLYLPPLGRGADVGPAAMLVAEQYCRDRGAMLLVDPHKDWQSVEQAIHGVRELGYASPNMLGYFPGVTPRRATDEPARAAGGAIAGLLCKLDRTYGPWQSLDLQGLGLHRSLAPAVTIDEDDAQKLARAGINALVAGRAGRSRLQGSVTMSRGLEAQREFASLPVRRLCLRIVNSVARATRWAVFEQDSDTSRQRIRAQVTAYLQALSDLGALADPRYVVECRAGANSASILLVFHPAGSDDAISLTLYLTGNGCRVVNTAFAPGIENCA